MLTRDLLTQTLPHLKLSDKVSQALQLMNDNHVTHLPVTEDEKFIGLVSEDMLLHGEDDSAELSEFQTAFINISVKDNEHFLTVIQETVENDLSIMPVVNEDNELLGSVTKTELLKNASDFMSLNEPGGMIVLEMEPKQYSFNELSRLIEANETQITQLNTSIDPATGMQLVTIKINKADVSDVVASLQRHEYNVKYYFGEELYENELRSNYDNLMNYLKI
ncbi:MAG: CBS domain-containing protein [Parafilimonas sp.]